MTPSYASPSSSELLSISVGLPKSVPWRGETVETGIFKSPVSGRVRAHPLGLDGDGQADLTVHGGIDKAVYAYDASSIQHWCKALSRASIEPGTFGENLTVSGLPESEVSIGDIFSIGSARFEVSQPRQPCAKLGLRFEDATFPKRFLKSLRVGFYLRVIEAGEIGAGDEIIRSHRDPAGARISDVVALAFGFPSKEPGAEATEENIERVLSVAALAEAWRPMLSDRLLRISGRGPTLAR